MHRILILLFLTIFNCKQDNSNKNDSVTSTKSELNTEKELLENLNELNVFYSRIKLDTVKYNQDLKIENTTHNLELKLYSSNDSSIVIENPDFKGVYHNSVAEILLTKNKDTILQKKLTKEIFKDSIDNNDYKVITLSEIGYENIRSNRIYFNVGFEEADNFSCFQGLYYQQCDIGIFFRTNKKGKVSYGNFRDRRE
ncbi:hypothetical protein FBALC1_05363 [Flavobacteriales bacterium ALC-1]|nr:hypothetical protein FBALC1_05363 [Flavobacteriales bacterium ALC-1]